jgi:hypothetical protein
VPTTESEARSVTIMVLVVLAGIWAAVLLPPYLQKRRAFHPHASIGDFRNQLAVLQRTGDPYAPRTAPTVGRRMNRSDVQRRRRDVLVTLAAAAGLTFLLALVTGGAVWLLHLSVDAALLGYVALLMQVQQQRPVNRANVRPLPAQPRLSATQQALLRRQAN